MRLQDLARSYRDVIPDPFVRWLAVEDAAAEICWYEPLLVPGILQTEAYALAIATALTGDEGRARRIAEFRMLRAERLLRPDGPRLRMVVDEAALLRHVGGAEVMGAQVAHLRSLVHVGRVELRVVPLTSGLPVRDPFACASTNSGPVVFLEHARGDVVLEGPEAADYAAQFERLWVKLEDHSRWS